MMQNEPNQTQQELEHLRRELAELQAECLRNRRQALLSHLLRGEYINEQLILTDLREVGIKLCRDSYMLLQVIVCNEPPEPIQTTESEYAPPQDFRQVYEDGICSQIAGLLPEYFAAGCPWESGVIAVLQMSHMKPDSPKDGGFITRLNQKALQLSDALLQQHGLSVYISLSRPHDGVSGIPDAFSELEEMNSYRSIMGLDVPLLCFHDFEVAEQDRIGDQTVLRLEQNYLNSVEMGNYEQARSDFMKLLEEEFYKNIPALHTIRYKLFARLDLLMITLHRFIPETDHRIYNDFLALHSDIIRQQLSITELKSRIDDIFNEIAQLLEEQQTPKWMPSLLGYLDSNFRNQELNVSSVSEVFGLNPSYMSREVKRCTGSSLLELLQKKRLDCAFALIGSGMTMTQAAVSSGFSDPRAFRRTARKFQEYTQ